MIHAMANKKVKKKMKKKDQAADAEGYDLDALAKAIQGLADESTDDEDYDPAEGFGEIDPNLTPLKKARKKN